MNQAAVQQQEEQGLTRVLVFSVDDGLFALHLDWVEAVYPRTSAVLRTVKVGPWRWQPVLIHRDDAAPVIDLRQAFGLHGVLGDTQRDAFLVLRSGSCFLALQVDNCMGVRDLDLRAHPPVPTSLVGDGGLCVGHLLDLDGAILTVLDPSRILDPNVRTVLEPALRRARGFKERQGKITALWSALQQAPTAAELRMFARLCSRNGRSKAAAAARLVLKHLPHAQSPDATEHETVGERVLCEVLRAAAQQRTGELIFEPDGGGGDGRVVLRGGRIVDASDQNHWGRQAVQQMVNARAGSCCFVETRLDDQIERMNESAVALVITALESGSTGRRRSGKHPIG